MEVESFRSHSPKLTNIKGSAVQFAIQIRNQAPVPGPALTTATLSHLAIPSQP